ncbi:uncharacterized protein LOC108117697 [Drosophila eugracilis]|uniref:uncharacterized protein LOC108117697 n=1 Tax=Drosophila eugracilis TaxID=29029 RepID=UPI0007E6405F|nr:uncharacterized protein LOC108117697 [Drosophila eugracilis]
MMNKSKQRSPTKAVKKATKSLPQAKVKTSSKVRPKVLRKSPKKNPLKKTVRRSPLMRAALKPTVLGSAKAKPMVKSRGNFKKSHRQPIDALQSLGMSRRTKLIDASPQKKAAGTPVLFLLKDSKGQKKKVAPGTGNRKPHSARMNPRHMTKTKSKATEGVDFFYNMGMRMQQPEKMKDQNMRQRVGAGFEGRLAGGGGTKFGGANVQGSRARPSPPGLSSIAGGITGICSKDVEVPLTNRLPIIDFISTNEFQNMYAATMRKPQSRKLFH